MPRLSVKKPVDFDKLTCGLPKHGSRRRRFRLWRRRRYHASGAGWFTPIDAATKKVPHQFFSVNGNGGYTDKCGDGNGNTKFYEFRMQEAMVQMHPDYAKTKVWGFDGQVPGPLVQARYGEPVMIRYHNHLPSVKVKQAFGIAEMSTHLHNAHTPSESDGNPVNYFNSVNDPNPVNPIGFKDQHYPNIMAGNRPKIQRHRRGARFAVVS